MGWKVPCEFEDCPVRVPLEDFEEGVWLPVFKATREHMGFLCPDHVRDLREGRLGSRWILTRSGTDELIIDMEPLPPPERTAPPAPPESV